MVAPNTDVSEQEIMDILKALNSIPITVELLRMTKIGQSLQGSLQLTYWFIFQYIV